METIFSTNPVNTGRQLELDIAKGLAVFFMIAVHVLTTLSEPEVQDTFFGGVIDFFGGIPAAPVFMFLLGFGIIYSRNASPELLAKRGVLLIGLGYLLNLLRGGLPFFTKYLISGYEPYLSEAIIEMLYVDILQFAGLALLFFACAKKMNLGVRGMAGCGLVFSFINLVIVNSKIENEILGPVASLFWGATDTSFFPFLTWIIYSIAGFVFGYYLIRCTDKKTLYLYGFFITLPLLVVYYLNEGMFDEYNYYQHTLFINCIFVIFIVFWISLLFFITPSIPGFCNETIKRWSKNVTDIYFVHWVLIGWLVFLLGYNTQYAVASFLLFAGVTVASDGLSFLYRKKAAS
jgi:hypothetical protein